MERTSGRLKNHYLETIILGKDNIIVLTHSNKTNVLSLIPLKAIKNDIETHCYRYNL